jgi:hypothetical protein
MRPAGRADEAPGIRDQPVSKFFETLASKLAERWLTLLALPGAVFVLAIWAGLSLGQENATDVHRLVMAADATATRISAWSAGAQIVAVVAITVAATGLGYLVRLAANLTCRIWLDDLAGIQAVTRRRAATLQRRWQEAEKTWKSLQRPYDPDGIPAAPMGSAQAERSRKALATMARMAHTRPARATWMGNRIHSLESLLANHYDIDLTWTWPRLWTILPNSPRSDLAEANAAFTTAAIRATWAVPWLLLALAWWPALPIACALAISGWRTARTAIDTLATLTEAIIDTHGPALAVALGLITDKRRLDSDLGRQITNLARKNR